MPRHHQKTQFARQNQKSHQQALYRQRANQANRTPEQQRETWNPTQHHLNNNPISPTFLIFILLNSGLLNLPTANAEKFRTDSESSVTETKQSATTPSSAAPINQDTMNQAAILHALNQQAQTQLSGNAKPAVVPHDKSQSHQEQSESFKAIEKLKEHLKEFANADFKTKRETYRMFYFFSGDDHFNEQLKVMLEAGLDGFQTVSDNSNSFETALNLGQAKNIKTYLDFYIKNNPTLLKNFLKTLVDQNDVKLDSSLKTCNTCKPEPLEFMIKKIYAQMKKNSFPILNTLLSIYPQFNILDSLLETTSFSLENNHLELLNWIFKKKLFFTQKANFYLKFSTQTSQFFGVDKESVEDYDTTLFMLSTVFNSNKITASTKEVFYELLLKTIDAKTLLNEIRAHHHALNNQIANLEKEGTNTNLASIKRQLKDLENLIHLIQKKSGFPLENFESCQDEANLLRPILITATSLSVGFGIYYCAETARIKSEQKKIDDLANAIREFSNRLGIDIDEDCCDSNSSEEHTDHSSLNQIIKNDLKKKDELKIHIKDFIMIPSVFFQKEADIPLHHYQGISYVVIKRIDYLKAIEIATKKFDFPIKIVSNEMILNGRKFTFLNPKVLLDFSYCFIQNLKIKNAAHFIQISNLKEDFNSIDLNELEKNIGETDTESKEKFDKIKEVFNDLQNRLSKAKPVIKSDQPLDLEPSTTPIQFERNAAVFWKNESQSLQQEITKLKNKIHFFKQAMQDKKSQPAKSPVSVQTPIEENSTSARRKKESIEPKWIFGDNSSSSSSSNDTGEKFKISNIKSTQKINLKPAKTSIFESPNPSKATSNIQKENANEVIEEKAKQAPLQLSNKESKRIQSLLVYLKQLQVLASKNTLDEDQFHGLKYLLMRTCVLLFELKSLTSSTFKINRFRNTMIHSLSISNGIPQDSLLALAKEIGNLNLDPIPTPQSKTEIEPILTQLINIIVNNEAYKNATVLFSPWKKAKKQTQTQAAIDSISPLDAITSISEHIQKIKTLLNTINVGASSTQTFFQASSPEDNHINHVIQWRVCAIHLCLELTPSLMENDDVKKYELNNFFKEIIDLRDAIAHETNEKKFKYRINNLKKWFTQDDHTSILFKINSMKFSLTPQKTL